MARITLGNFSQRAKDEPHPQARDRSFPVPGDVRISACVRVRVARVNGDYGEKLTSRRGGGGEDQYRGG
jgi:hypothetical protein